MVYTGQGLPAAAFEVWNLLIKELNVREALSREEEAKLQNTANTNAPTVDGEQDASKSIAS